MPNWYATASPFLQGLYDWQTLIAGGLAIVAGILTVAGTVRATRMQMRGAAELARQEIGATNAAAKLEVDAAREQTAAITAQNEDMKKAERRRHTGETLAIAG